MKAHLLFLFLILFLFSACKTNLLVVEDILPSARFEGFEPRFEQASFTDFELKLDLFYRFRNPYDKALPIPAHRMGVRLNGDPLRDLWVEKEEVIPAKSSVTIRYPFQINSETLRNFLGRENEITFHTSVDVDISTYTDLLPSYDLRISENFQIDSSQSRQLLRGLLQRKVSKRTLELEKTVRLKLPAPPRISRSDEPILVEWMGGRSDLINLNQLKENLTPFGDLILNGEINQWKNPFLASVIEREMTIPAPTLTCPTCTTKVKLVGPVLDLIRPLDNNIDDKWETLKGQLYRENPFSPMDYVVERFLVHLNDDADDFWETFQTGWTLFKNAELPESIPTPDTRGFRISIPVRFQNANDFPVKVPLFRASSFLASGEPFSIQLRTRDMPEVSLDQIPRQRADIPANQSTTLYVTFSLDWAASSGGIYDFLTGSPLNPNVMGVLSYDFGYGPLFLKYDLGRLNMEYETGN